MLSLYIDNRVTYQERAFIEEHISNCEECYKKYIYLKSLIKDLKDSYRHILELTRKKQEQKFFRIKEHEKFLDSLYPYVDNELETQECLEFRRYLTQSPAAQRQLKSVYTLQKELRNSFDKTQKSLNKDFAPRVIDAVKQQRERIEFRRRVMFGNTKPIPKLAKVAVLLGLLVFGGYELEQLYKIYKAPTSIEEQKIKSTLQENNFSQDVSFTAEQKK